MRSSKRNYIGILTWAIVLGIALKNASDTTRHSSRNFSDAIAKMVGWVIKLAPLGIMGIVIGSVTENGLSSLLDYGNLLLVLIGTMLVVALIVNPLIVFINVRQNPYPLVFKCIGRVELPLSSHEAQLQTFRSTWNYVRNLTSIKRRTVSRFRSVPRSIWRERPSRFPS